MAAFTATSLPVPDGAENGDLGHYPAAVRPEDAENGDLEDYGEADNELYGGYDDEEGAFPDNVPAPPFTEDMQILLTECCFWKLFTLRNSAE